MKSLFSGNASPNPNDAFIAAGGKIDAPELQHLNDYEFPFTEEDALQLVDVGVWENLGMGSRSVLLGGPGEHGPGHQVRPAAECVISGREPKRLRVCLHRARRVTNAGDCVAMQGVESWLRDWPLVDCVSFTNATPCVARQTIALVKADAPSVPTPLGPVGISPVNFAGFSFNFPCGIAAFGYLQEQVWLGLSRTLV